MLKIESLLAGLSAAALMLIALPASAGAGAAGCEDLSGIAETPMVDFQSQIQPILDSCTGCHGDPATAGMDLRAGESYDNLVGITSTTNNNRLRVEPFEPGSSALLLAVNCQSPGGPGFQMGNVDVAQRALIRDWIAQGALPEPAGIPEPVSVPVDDYRGLALLTLILLLTGLVFVKASRP